jgi:hypothetical protein
MPSVVFKVDKFYVYRDVYYVILAKLCTNPFCLSDVFTYTMQSFPNLAQRRMWR